MKLKNIIKASKIYCTNNLIWKLIACLTTKRRNDTDDSKFTTCDGMYLWS